MCIIQHNILFDLGNGHPPQMAKRGRRKANPSTRNRTTYDITGGEVLSTRDNAATLAMRRNNAMFLAYNLPVQPILDIVDLTHNTSR